MGYVISSEGIAMDPTKVKTVVEWQIPRSVRDVQCFLGFANLLRKSLVKKLLKLSCVKYVDIMAFPIVSSATVDPSSYRKEILTFVDRYTKMAHFFPCTKEISSEETVEIVMREVCRPDGLPDSIISDCGP